MHAALLLLSGGVSVALRNVLFATVAGAVSLVALALRYRGRWTPSGALGSANLVTAWRLGMVVGLGILGLRAPGPAAACLVLFIFTLDAVDGWLARRGGTASPFGAAFDMECDALLLLVCSLMLYLHGRLGAFVLVPGFLRYLYVTLLAFLPEISGEAPRSRLGRWVCGLVTTSMTVSLWPIEPVHEPLAAVATLLVTYSFGRSFVWCLKQVRREGLEH